VRTPDVEAAVKFLTAQDGGRQTPVATGYRGDVFYRGQDHVTVHEFVGTQVVEPGSEVTVLMRFLHPELLYAHFRDGEEFEVREGSRTVARGKVTRVVDLVQHGLVAKS